jgi:ATP-dependent helicase/nuclease subunit B
LLSVRVVLGDKEGVQVRFLLGPAGSGKTWRCLAEARAALAADPAGGPLILLAPKQATFQLERQLLAAGEPAGFARLQIFSFERLAGFVLDQAGVVAPHYLSEEGRVMVLRALLMVHEPALGLFRRSARRTGFARQLSQVLAELQQHQVSAGKLRDWAGRDGVPAELQAKLRDLAMLLEAYRNWTETHRLQDGSHLLDLAAGTLRDCLGRRGQPHLRLGIDRLWLDGFAEMTPQELDLLMAVLPHCREVTLAFCLDAPGGEASEAGGSWLSIWSAVGKLYQQCRQRVALLPEAVVTVETLGREAGPTRFAGSPALQALELGWARNFLPGAELDGADGAADGIRLVACADAEAEATCAARAILQFVRAGGRYRECAVIVRSLEGYHKALARSFRRYEIPFFLDRRESIAHHPLAELTRSALRTVAHDWAHEDWFSALKAGFTPVAESEIDRLENESLARGWRGKKWREPMQISESSALTEWAEDLRQRIFPPFGQLARHLGVNQSCPTGGQLAAAMRQLWRTLRVEEILEQWSTATVSEAAIHRTVLEQMNAWLEDVERAFAGEALALRDWLPILDAGLAGLTVGVIPPALDQVLVGAIDRARNPELKLTVLLGLNEGVFPATPAPPAILTEDDRAELNQRAILLGPDLRERLARERFYGYIACTRSSEQLLLVHALHDAAGKALNPSPFLGQVQRRFPGLAMEVFAADIPWQQAETAGELAPVLAGLPAETPPVADGVPQWSEVLAWPVVGDRVRRLQALREPAPTEPLSPALAQTLYGSTLRTSVSRLEEFAACPFRFFVKSGLQAGERKVFELDARERGNFQHEVLKSFHERVESEHRRWRDLTPLEARETIGVIARDLMREYRDGLFRESAKTLFAARAMTGALQDFVEVIVTWLRGQYEFDPTLAEAAFDHKPGSRLPAWDVPLGADLPGLKLSLHGRIDRVDVWREPGGDRALAVVIDYKSSGKKLDPVLVENGVQLQLPVYLNVLRHWPHPDVLPGLRRLEPAGVFYVNLRGAFEAGGTRDEVIAGAAQARQQAYRHTGKFDASRLPQLDRSGNADQFNYRVNKDGSLRKGSPEALEPAEFLALLDGVETQLVRMGRQIYAGAAAVDPYRKGSSTPCDYCDFAAVCRIDPWTHVYRRLKAKETSNSNLQAPENIQ